MPRYQLKDKCLFVDAMVYDEKNRKPTLKKKPDDISLAHVMDKSKEPNDADYLALNDAAAFIARFIVMGVDTKDIPEILKSEYGSKVTDPAAEVKAVVALLKDYLEPRTFARPYEAPKKEGGGKHSGKYDLDFRVNWFGTGGFKGPL
jgi:hypothetical protein